MATVVKSWVFLSTIDGWGIVSPALPTAAIAWESADGAPSNGCLRVTRDHDVGDGIQKYRSVISETWESWGVPAGSEVQSIQLTLRAKTQDLATTQVLDARVVNPAFTSVTSATGDLIDAVTLPAPSAWTTLTGSTRTVDPAAEQSTQGVRLELEINAIEAGINTSDFRFDTLDLTITYTAPAAAAAAGPAVDIRLYTALGKRKYMPEIASLNFELQERGGMGAGDMTLNIPWEDFDLDGNEYVDVRLFTDEVIYRGFVEIAQRDIEPTEKASPTLQSLVSRLNKYTVRWKYAYGGVGADVSVIAGDILTDFVNQSSRGAARWATPDLDTVGIILYEFDARGRSVAQALNMLCDHASGGAIWGVEAPTVLTDRFYFRPKPTATGKYYSIGGAISAYSYPEDTGPVVNVLKINGGPSKQPNLVYNGSFEEVAPASETVANLLLDYSFEDNDAAWTLTGSRKYTAMDVTARGVPKTGKYWLELDTNTESGIQTVLAPYTVVYTGIAWVRQETAGTGRQVKLTLEGLNSVNAVVVTSPGSAYVTAADDWEKISVELDPTAYPTVVKIRFRVETNGGTASQDGVLVDDCAIIEKNGEGAIGWRRIVAGAADASVFSWAFKTTGLPAAQANLPHGGYAVHIDATGIAISADYVEIRTTKDKRIEVPPNERISFLVAVGGGPVTFSMGIIEYDSAGANVATNESSNMTHVVNSAVYEFWLTGTTEGPGMTTNANTRSIEVFIRYRDAAADPMYIDKVFVCTGARPTEISIVSNAITNYWAGENYETRLKVTDARFTGAYDLIAAADASITTYGEREAEEDNPLVTDETSALVFATEYFDVNAVATVMARLSISALQESGELLDCADGKVKIVNLPSAPVAMNPVRVAYSIKPDSVSMNADLGTETPRLEGLLRYAQGKERGRQF